MPPEVFIVPAVFGIPAAVILAKMWFRHKETMARLGSSPERTRELEDRMVRVEQAVDAIAVEVERIGEGQRFVTKLLSDRAPQLAEGLPSSERPGTAR